MNNNITNLNRVDLPYPILVAHQPEFMPWLGNLAKASMGDVYYILDKFNFCIFIYETKLILMTQNFIKTNGLKSILLPPGINLVSLFRPVYIKELYDNIQSNK
jgi:hypothetical protein